MPSDLIRGWVPVRVKKTRQNKRLEPRSDSIGTEKALARGELAYGRTAGVSIGMPFARVIR
jgi:hypothetical protein